MSKLAQTDFAVGTYIVYRCFNMDCSGEQVLAGEFTSFEDAEAFVYAQQAADQTFAFSIEYYNGMVYQGLGLYPGTPVEGG